MVRHCGGATLQLEGRLSGRPAAMLDYPRTWFRSNEQEKCRNRRRPMPGKQMSRSWAFRMKHCFFSQHIDSSKLPIDSLTTRVASPMSHLTVARALSACSAAAPPRQRYTSSHVQQRLAGGASWLAAGLCRRRQCRHRTAAGLFGGLFGGGSSSGSGNDEELQPLENDEGGLMVALDANSSGSLDGSSEEPFGPLVRLEH